MVKIKTLKTQANNMRRHFEAKGIKLSAAQALEGIAAQYGFDTWDALVGVVKAASSTAIQQDPPTLADVNCRPENIRVECGSVSTVAAVAHYSDGLASLHSPALLEALFTFDPQTYPEKWNEVALELQGDGDSFKFTFEELRGIVYEKLGGKSYFYAPNVETYFQILDWTPPVVRPPALLVPESEKSAKGTHLITVPSGDGSRFDAHVIVPAHLDATVIENKLSSEIRRLKAADSTDELGEYTEEDLVRFSASLGCHWVVNSVVASETWD
jgi:hypothetical protein